jgi:hypothetical protein
VVLPPDTDLADVVLGRRGVAGSGTAPPGPLALPLVLRCRFVILAGSPQHCLPSSNRRPPAFPVSEKSGRLSRVRNVEHAESGETTLSRVKQGS